MRVTINGAPAEVDIRPSLWVDEIPVGDGLFRIGEFGWRKIAVSGDVTVSEPTVIAHGQQEWTLFGVQMADGLLSFERAVLRGGFQI